MARMTQKVWEGLTEKERELLKSIGIRPNHRSKTIIKKTWHVKPPEPYTLLITTRCELCGSSPRQFFRMTLKDDPTCLQATPFIYDKEAPLPKGTLKREEVYSSTCSECPKELMKWEKADLIKKLLKAFPIASVGGYGK